MKTRSRYLRVWDHVEFRGWLDCWPWLGGTNDRGYGRMQRGRKGEGMVPAHRAAYEAIFGPVPDELVMDHLCENPNCVNPLHMEPVTTRVNILRGTSPSALNARTTHCPQGHPYSGDNLKLVGRGRGCRACNVEATRRWRQEASA